MLVMMVELFPCNTEHGEFRARLLPLLLPRVQEETSEDLHQINLHWSATRRCAIPQRRMILLVVG